MTVVEDGVLGVVYGWSMPDSPRGVDKSRPALLMDMLRCLELLATVPNNGVLGTLYGKK